MKRATKRVKKMKKLTLRDALAGVVARGKKDEGGKAKGKAVEAKKKAEGKKKGKKGKKATLASKLGKIVSRKKREAEARADALGDGLRVVDVARSMSAPTALTTIGACPLLDPVVLGDAMNEVPIARIEVCTGKDCKKRGSEAIVDDLRANLPRGWKCEARAKCIGGCKRGVNARLTTAIGKETFSRLDQASARALFVPMALATNELNASFDDSYDDLGTSHEMDVAVRGRRRRVPVVDAAESIENGAPPGEVYCPPGFIPKIQ